MLRRLTVLLAVLAVAAALVAAGVVLPAPENPRVVSVVGEKVEVGWTEPDGSRAPVRYNMYVDGASAGTSTNTLDYFTVTRSGEHTFAVSAVYSDGESARSPEIRVTVNLPSDLAPPTSPEATVTTDRVVVRWQAPSGSDTPLSYRLYIDDVLKGESKDTGDYFSRTGVASGVHEFGVTAVYASGESEPAVATFDVGGATPPPAGGRWQLPLQTFRDKLQGGWAAQMIGVSYGSVYEFKSNGVPITGPLRKWEPGFVANSLRQDDIYVEMTFLKTLEREGLDFTQRDIANDFIRSKYELWHANKAGRFNLRNGISPSMSGHPRYNPHADDIDFQIEADLFGLIAPGMPKAACDIGTKVGSMINWGDGLYGGRFVMAMYAQAYRESQPTPEAVRRCIDAGLKAIPAASLYAQAIRDTLAAQARYPDNWLEAWRDLEAEWGETDHYCPRGMNDPFNIDAKLNGAYVVMGLLYGEGNFERTMEIATRCGQDADCNPATAAGVLGTIYGYKRIPAQFTSGIPDLYGTNFLYTEYDYLELLDVCEELAKDLIVRQGGEVDGDMLLIRTDTATAPATLDQMYRFGDAQLADWLEDYNRRLGL